MGIEKEIIVNNEMNTQMQSCFSFYKSAMGGFTLSMLI